MYTHNFINEIFSKVSARYDLMNDLMSLGLHRRWKRHFLRQLTPRAVKLLDVATGTGDIALAFHKQMIKAGYQPEIVACDPNADMLAQARAKAINQNILQGLEYLKASAEYLPFEDNSFDYYTIAFGIRNVTNIKAALLESYRVLKPRGKFCCLEFSQVNVPILKQLYRFYNTKYIPYLGKIVANNEAAYQYLVDSIAAFPNRFAFSAMLRDAGFKQINFITLDFGIVAIHIGYKNAE